MIGQNANGNRLEGPTLLHGTMDLSQAVNLFNEKVARSVRKSDRKEETAALDVCTTIVRHIRSYHDWHWWARGACHRARIRATRWLCPPYKSWHALSFSRHDLPELCIDIAPKKSEGAGKTGCISSHPQPCVLEGSKESTQVTAGTPKHRPSLRNGFNGCSVLSPVSGLCSHRHFAKRPAKLDTSVGMSGPHGLAVRDELHSSNAACASTASRSNTRDDREAPLLIRRRDGSDMIINLRKTEEKYFSRKDLTRAPITSDKTN